MKFKMNDSMDRTLGTRCHLTILCIFPTLTIVALDRNGIGHNLGHFLRILWKIHWKNIKRHYPDTMES